MRFTVSFLSADAPAPTGSSTTGTPARLALCPAKIMESTVRAFSVPMFNTSACAMAAISPASAASSAIIGDAPTASTMFATSFTVT